MGPGNYSVGLGVAMIILGLVYGIPHLNKRFAAEKPVDEGLKRKVIHMIVILVVYGFLMNIIGYFLASIVFFILMFRIVGFKPWPTIKKRKEEMVPAKGESGF
ncbi:MAG: tripartite tricarboxylate transporter TctB family protein [Pseudomonadota bacterium]